MKKVALFFCATVLLMLFCIATVLLLLGEQQLKRVVCWAADTVLDADLRIDGSFRVDFPRALRIEAHDVDYRARDGSLSLRVGTLQAQIEPGHYLRRGNVHLDALVLENVAVNADLPETEDNALELDDLQLPPVIVSNATVRELVVVVTRDARAPAQTLRLDELSIARIGGGVPVTMRATGSVDSKPFTLSGQFTPVPREGYERFAAALELQLQSSFADARISGNIEDPLRGLGAELHVEAVIPDTGVLAVLLGDLYADLGALSLSARVHGSYEHPGIDGLTLRLQRAPDVAIDVTGAIGRLREFDQASLRITAEVHDAELLSHIPFEALGAVKHLQVAAHVATSEQHIRLADVRANMHTQRAVSLYLSGDADIAPGSTSRNNAGMRFEFAAPSSQIFDWLAVGNAPEMGQTTGSANLAIGTDAIAVYDLQLRSEAPGQHRLDLRGDTGPVSFDEPGELPDFDLDVQLRTHYPEAIAKLFAVNIPPLGETRLHGRLSSRAGQLELRDAEMSSGSASGIRMKATGSASMRADDPSRFSTDLRVQADVRELSLLGSLIDRELPELGETRVQARFKASTGSLSVTDARIAIGDASAPSLVVTGSARRASNASSFALEYQFDVDELLRAYTRRDAAELGRVAGRAVISDRDGSLGVESLYARAELKGVYTGEIEGRVDDLAQLDQGNVVVDFRLDDPAALGDALGLPLGRLPGARHHGRIKLAKRHLHVLNKLSLGDTDADIEVNGEMKLGTPSLSATVRIPELHLADVGLALRKANDRRAERKNGGESGTDTRIFSRERIDLGFLNSIDLRLDFAIDEVSGESLRFDRVDGRLRIGDGKLVVKPMRFGFEGGNADLNLEVRAAEVPSYGLSVIADDLQLGPLLSQMQGDVPVRGYSNVRLQLASTGSSAYELASNLDGEMLLGFENLRIPQRLFTLLSVDTFGWVLAQSRISQYANLNCVVMNFDVDEGVIRSRSIIADGPQLSIGGKVDVDLEQETLDIVLIPKQKKRLFSSATPVQVRGPIANPAVKAIPGKAALAEVAGYTVLGGIFIPVNIVGKAWSILSDGDKAGGGCAKVSDMAAVAQKKLKSG